MISCSTQSRVSSRKVVVNSDLKLGLKKRTQHLVVY